MHVTTNNVQLFVHTEQLNINSWAGSEKINVTTAYSLCVVSRIPRWMLKLFSIMNQQRSVQ